MKIRSFQVQKYRSVQDSGKIDLLDDLTCIVGKNQSGKTALLKALWKFNPRSNNPYDLRREWPRGQRNQQNKSQVVCKVWFELSDEEKAELADLTTEQLSTDEVLVTKDYEGKFEVEFPCKSDLFPNKLHPNAIDNACDALREPQNVVGAQFMEVAKVCIQEARTLAKEGRFSQLSSLRERHDDKLREAFTPGNPQPQHSHEKQFLGEHISRLQGVENELTSAPTMHGLAHDFIVERLPVFIYMDDYLRFEGRARLNELKQRRDSGNTAPADDTFLMILELANLDLMAGVSRTSRVCIPQLPRCQY